MNLDAQPLTRIDPNPSPRTEQLRPLYTDCSRIAASWISDPAACSKDAVVMAFSLSFLQPEEDSVVIHVTADQYYRLSLDGAPAVMGCDSNSPENWRFETYAMHLTPGPHELRALVWHYGQMSPENRNSLGPGFWLAAEGDPSRFNTGTAAWNFRRISTVNFFRPTPDPDAWMAIPPHEEYRPRAENRAVLQLPVVTEPGREGRQPRRHDCHCLCPSPIPRLDRDWIFPGQAIYCDDRNSGEILVESGFVEGRLEGLNRALNHKSVRIPPHSRQRIIFELDNYYCAFTRLDLTGGKDAVVQIRWAEAGFTHPQKHEKGERRLRPGQYFRGTWDRIVTDGQKHSWTPLAWRCGRLVELHVVTAETPLEIDRFVLREHRYPLTPESEFVCDDSAVNALLPFCFRTLQMNTHDSFVDCPYYERLLYAGDGRIEALTCMISCRDDIPVREAISTLAFSRDFNGMIMARWPSATRQYIPSFSLWWIGMLYDFARWRDDGDFVKAHLPFMRNLLEGFLARCGNGVFLHGVPWEWNFIDWVDEWQSPNGSGTPPGITEAANASYNWLFVYILGLAEQLELYVGEKYPAQRWRQAALGLADALTRTFWNQSRGLFQEDESGKYFSVHAQILALLSARLPESIASRLGTALLDAAELSPPSIFFRHYLFEAFTRLGRPDRLLDGLDLWHAFIAKGFKTVPETPENKTFNQRSDCHGWGAHPIYHLIGGVAGITPAEMGFRSVRIAPLPGRLTEFRARCVHPAGIIQVDFQKVRDENRYTIELPKKITGTLMVNGQDFSLEPGRQTFCLPSEIPYGERYHVRQSIHL